LVYADGNQTDQATRALYVLSLVLFTFCFESHFM